MVQWLEDGAANLHVFLYRNDKCMDWVKYTAGLLEHGTWNFITQESVFFDSEFMLHFTL